MRRIWQMILGVALATALAAPAQAGSRHASLRSKVDSGVYEVGDFRIEFENSRKPKLTVTHVNEPDRAIWETRPGKSFIRSAQSYFHVEEHRGSFNIDEYNYRDLTHQKLEAIYQEYDQVVLLGSLRDYWGWNKAQFAMIFHQTSTGHLQFEVDVWDGSCWFWF